MGLILLFEGLFMLASAIAKVIATLLVIAAVIALIIAVVLFVVGAKRRPKGKRKAFFIPAVVLCVPAVIIGAISLYVAVFPPKTLVDYIEEWEGDHRVNMAVSANDVELLRELLEDGADPNEYDKMNGGHVLHNHFITRRGYAKGEVELEMLELLLEYGSDPNTVQLGDTVLHELCDREYLSDYQYEAIKLLLEYGANPNTENSRYRSPLMLYCWRRDSDLEDDVTRIPQLLLEYGANINQVDVDGNTALWWLLRGDDYNRELAEFLIANGAVE